MIEFILKLAAVSFLAVAVLCGCFGVFKSRRLKRSDFRWEIDMMNERRRIQSRTVASFTLFTIFGAIAAVASALVR